MLVSSLRITLFSLFSCKVIDYDFVTDPSTTIVTYGDTLLLRCTPPRRYPLAVTITWYKDYAEMVLGSTISVTGDNSLRIASITRSSEGVYFCQAYNSVTKETRTSKTATVSVRGLFKINSNFSVSLPSVLRGARFLLMRKSRDGTRKEKVWRVS